MLRPLVIWFLLVFAVTVPVGADDSLQAVIAIQPLGKVDSERMAVVKAGLEQTYGVAVTTLPAVPLAQAAWYAPRQRYRADKLLDQLAGHRPAVHRIVIGLTASDISVSKDEHEDWGIFGLGQIDGNVCVVSTFRLGARGANEAKLRERLRKIAIHEVGHVMGLEHCPANGCVMADAEGSIATVDAANGAFCTQCGQGWKKWLKRKDS